MGVGVFPTRGFQPVQSRKAMPLMCGARGVQVRETVRQRSMCVDSNLGELFRYNSRVVAVWP
jgi:hypothetical protein